MPPPPPPPPTWTSALFGGAFCSKSPTGNWRDNTQPSLVAKVRLLDDKDLVMSIDAKALGRQLLDLVCQNINLIESSYFGLEFIDDSNQFFYVPDPTQLQCEYTRYLFALQIRRDLAQGVLACAESTSVLLASYIAQAEFGPKHPNKQPCPIYGNRTFFPHQTEEHERRIESLHRKHGNLSPAEADYHLLDIARKIDFYGLRLKPACDHDKIALELTVSHAGLAVFQGLTRINTFPWARIRKICFKRKKFLVKLQPDNYGYYKDTIEFYFTSKNACKCFWKSCIENHSFFRLCIACKPSSMLSAPAAPAKPTPAKKAKRILLTKGSSFRYAHLPLHVNGDRVYALLRYIGLTLKETIEQAKTKLTESVEQEPVFTRLQSDRALKRSLISSSSSSSSGGDPIDKNSPPTVGRHRNNNDECFSSTHGSRTLSTQSSVDMSSCSDVVALVSQEEKQNNSNLDDRIEYTYPVDESCQLNQDSHVAGIDQLQTESSPVRQLFSTLLNLSDSTSSERSSSGDNPERKFGDPSRLDVSSSPVYRSSSSNRDSSPSGFSSGGEYNNDSSQPATAARQRNRTTCRSSSRHSRAPPQVVRQRRRTRHRSTTSRRRTKEKQARSPRKLSEIIAKKAGKVTKGHPRKIPPKAVKARDEMQLAKKRI